MKRLVVFVSVLGVFVGLNGAELSVSNLVAAQFKATNSALNEFRGVFNTNNAHALGFVSTNEFSTATVGQPFRVYQVPLDRLRAYQSSPFNSLLEPAPRMIFPVLIGAQTKSSMVLRLESGQWVSDRFGGPEIIKGLAATRDALATHDQRWATESFAVEIPVVALWFVGYTNSAKKVQLVTPIDLQIGGLTLATNATVTPAFMKKLAEIANRYTGRSN